MTSKLDGSRRRRITKNEGADFSPVWSPDGTQIAFASERGEEFGFRVYTMDPDGSDVRGLAPSIPADGRPPAWSPDGQSIAFVGIEAEGGDLRRPNAARTQALYTVGVDGSGLTRLGETVGPPAWSPDGSRIAFPRKDGDAVAVWTIGPDGSVPTRVISRQAVVWQLNVSWSPDGRRLLLSGGFPIGVVNADGSGFRDLAMELEASFDRMFASWSPDGSRIAVYKPTTGGTGERLHTNVVFTVAPDGSGKRVLVRRGSHGLVAESEWRDATADTASCSEGFVIPDPDSKPGLVKDCETLLKVRDTLGGDTALFWSAETPMEDWEGVRIGGPDSAPRVQVIDLRDRNLSGIIPPGLAELTGLESLGLSRNSLRGTIPPELGRLANLKGLSLPSNSVSGSIPSELGELNNLTRLLLDDNALTGNIPSELGKLGKLELFHIDDNGLTGCIPKELADNPKLHVLSDGLRFC